MIHLKSDREIEHLKAAADLVSRTLGEVARLIGPGVTTEQLDHVAEEFIRDNGAVPAFKGYGPSSNPFPSTLCTSVNDVVVHGIPNDKPLKSGDIVSVDCGVLLNGFYGDSAYTFGIGELGSDVRQLCTVTYESLLRGVDQTNAGRRTGDIGYAVQSHCEPYGYGVVKALVGHGIGRSLHEDPQVPNFGRSGTGRKLKNGLVICIEPMINMGSAEVHTDHDGWTVRTADRKPSAHYEFMVALRPGGTEVLTTYSYVEDVLDSTPYNQPADTQHG